MLACPKTCTNYYYYYYCQRDCTCWHALRHALTINLLVEKNKGAKKENVIPGSNKIKSAIDICTTDVAKHDSETPLAMLFA